MWSLHLVLRSKNEWSYTSTPQYAFMAWCLVKAQGQLYLLPLPHITETWNNFLALTKQIYTNYNYGLEKEMDLSHWQNADRLSTLMLKYRLNGTRKQGWPFKSVFNWDWIRSTNSTIYWQHDNDDDFNILLPCKITFLFCLLVSNASWLQIEDAFWSGHLTFNHVISVPAIDRWQKDGLQLESWAGG